MKVFFVSYYKYDFSFKTEDGRSFTVGGDSDDIYRFEVRPEMELKEIEERFGEVTLK